jgi:hypothetical protein
LSRKVDECKPLAAGRGRRSQVLPRPVGQLPDWRRRFILPL